MSTKRKKKPKPVQNHSEQKMFTGGNQIFYQKTIIAAVIAGALLTIFFVFAPAGWWQPEDAGTSVERHNMVGLVAASLTLSALILTNNASESPYKTVLFVAAGAAAWVAAFIAPEVQSLKLALWMLLCLSPLTITLSRVSGLYVPKVTFNNIGTWLLLFGIAFVVIPLVVESTKIKLLVLFAFVHIFGEAAGGDVAFAFLAIMAVTGVGFVLIAMGCAFAMSTGKQRPML